MRRLSEEEKRALELRSVRPRHDDPDLPDDVRANDLDRGARNELKTLTKENAEWVARHLVMAARLIDEDPVQAHRHSTSAARRAGRIAMVRESYAITAYATGDFGLALRELRTYRRISGSDEQLPLMVDSERGLGRPDRALELGRSVDRAALSTPTRVALSIAMSGARLDQEQPEAALLELEIPELDATRAFSWSAELFAAYATVLEELGRVDEAADWRTQAERAERALEAEYDVVDVIVEGDDAEGDDAEGDAPSDGAEAVAPGDGAEAVARGDGAEGDASSDGVEAVAPGDDAQGDAPGGGAEGDAPGVDADGAETPEGAGEDPVDHDDATGRQDAAVDVSDADDDGSEEDDVRETRP